MIQLLLHWVVRSKLLLSWEQWEAYKMWTEFMNLCTHTLKQKWRMLWSQYHILNAARGTWLWIEVSISVVTGYVHAQLNPFKTLRKSAHHIIMHTLLVFFSFQDILLHHCPLQ